jgi:hypothetical protein
MNIYCVNGVAAFKIGVKSLTLKHFHSSYMFRHITRHPQGSLIFLAKITFKTTCKT